jgi:hypothetical protein
MCVLVGCRCGCGSTTTDATYTAVVELCRPCQLVEIKLDTLDARTQDGEKARAQASKRARSRAREQESKRAREQESKRAREQESVVRTIIDSFSRCNISASSDAPYLCRRAGVGGALTATEQKFAPETQFKLVSHRAFVHWWTTR